MVPSYLKRLFSLMLSYVPYFKLIHVVGKMIIYLSLELLGFRK